jgi:hypothetical protein
MSRFRSPFPKLPRDERGVAYCAPRTKWVVMFAGKCPVRFVTTGDVRRVCELVTASKATVFGSEKEAIAAAREHGMLEGEFKVEGI